MPFRDTLASVKAKEPKPKPPPPPRSVGAKACRETNEQQRPTRRQVRAIARRDGPSRLPDGAVAVVVYDAKTETWTGTLTIGDQEFRATRSALFTLLSVLDGQYRKGSQPVVESATPAPGGKP